MAVCTAGKENVCRKNLLSGVMLRDEGVRGRSTLALNTQESPRRGRTEGESASPEDGHRMKGEQLPGYTIEVFNPQNDECTVPTSHSNTLCIAVRSPSCATCCY